MHTVFRLAAGLLLASVVSGSLFAKGSLEGQIDESVVLAFESKDIAMSEVSILAWPVGPSVRSRPQGYTHGGDRPINPASVVKLVTTAYAIEKLGTGFQFRTGFHVQQPPVDGVLSGSLYIKGGGDPRFLTADLWSSLLRLRQQGLRTIQGDVVVDRSLFATPTGEMAAGGDDEEFDDAPHRAYHASPDAMLMNHGAMLLHLKVDEASRVIVVPDEAPSSWAFVSELKPQGGRCTSWKNGLDVSYRKSGNDVIVTVSGQYPIRCGNAQLPIQIPNQEWLMESWVREIWVNQLGGVLNGRVVGGTTPADSVALYTHFGDPLSSIVRDINKWSSNVMARQLELYVSGTPDRFNSDVKAWLGGLGVNHQKWFLENGSGLSRNTRITGIGLAELLKAMADRADFPDYLASLPRAGADGTLHRKMKNIDHFAYLKTGSLSGVRSAAGYLRAQSGQMYVLVMMVQSPRAYNAWPGFERMAEVLYKNH